jgi:hypothetical protein
MVGAPVIGDGSSKAWLLAAEVEQRYEFHAAASVWKSGVGEREMRHQRRQASLHLPETHVATDAPVHAKATTSTPGMQSTVHPIDISSGPTAALPLSGCVGALLLHDRQCTARRCSRGDNRPKPSFCDRSLISRLVAFWCLITVPPMNHTSSPGAGYRPRRRTLLGRCPGGVIVPRDVLDELTPPCELEG